MAKIAVLDRAQRVGEECQFRPGRRGRTSRRFGARQPHLGYGVAETWRDFYPRSIENALAFLDGKPIRVVTPP
jgi:hypothetical protein